MAYDQKLANRIRTTLLELNPGSIEEKKMFRGISFLVNGKMCLSVSGDELMCRINPELQDEASEKPGCRLMVMKERIYKGYFYVSQDGLKDTADYNYWISKSLEFNKISKASSKRNKPKKVS